MHVNDNYLIFLLRYVTVFSRVSYLKKDYNAVYLFCWERQIMHQILIAFYSASVHYSYKMFMCRPGSLCRTCFWWFE